MNFSCIGSNNIVLSRNAVPSILYTVKFKWALSKKNLLFLLCLFSQCKGSFSRYCSVQAGIGQAPVSHLTASTNRGRWLTGAWPIPVTQCRICTVLSTYAWTSWAGSQTPALCIQYLGWTCFQHVHAPCARAVSAKIGCQLADLCWKTGSSCMLQCQRGQLFKLSGITTKGDVDLILCYWLAAWASSMLISDASHPLISLGFDERRQPSTYSFAIY